ncbi:helix-turn-helix domain-containing protein [Actinoplanes rectilineatus]|uniref:helix-turn-helix domain-containing protein n=1 Tax=Actinoplanes rectilineatus TaxID=113571 RepID=UPI000AFFBFCC|nr:helix-turn-helix transcriptional regulator [Actinoplanes rectilineatus]
MAVQGGSIARRKLGIELRKLRIANGLTGEQVASRFDWSPSKISRIERGQSPTTPRDCRDLLTLYGLSERSQVDTLVQLASVSRSQDWWHRYDDVVHKQFAHILGLEAAASAVLTFEPVVVPGLLQTARYAEGLVLANGPSDNEEHVRRRVEARMLRQQVLTGPEAPRIHAVIDEAVLHRRVGGTDVMHEQLLHIADASGRPNTTVQVLPFGSGAYMPVQGGFIALRFADTDDGDIVSVELLARTLYIDDAREVAMYRDAWESVLSTAASPTDSLALIMAAIEEMRHESRTREL